MGTVTLCEFSGGRRRKGQQEGPTKSDSKGRREREMEEERTPETSAAYVPSEDFTSYARAELSDALSEALFELYKGGPTRPSEAGDFLCHAFGSSIDAHPSMSNMRPPHRVKEEFVRYVEASGFPRQLHRAMALLHKAYVSGEMSRSGMSATAFVRDKMLAAKQRRHMARLGTSYMGVDERQTFISDAETRHHHGNKSVQSAESGDDMAGSGMQQELAGHGNDERGSTETNTPSIDDTARSLLFTSSDRPEKASTESSGETEPETEKGEEACAAAEDAREQLQASAESSGNTAQPDSATTSTTATAAVVDAEEAKKEEAEEHDRNQKDAQESAAGGTEDESNAASEPVAESTTDTTEENAESVSTAVDTVAAGESEQPVTAIETKPEENEKNPSNSNE